MLENVKIIDVISVIVAIACAYSLIAEGPNTEAKHCWIDIFKNETKCRPNCPKGEFSLAGMESCHPWLTCNEFKDVKVIELLYTGTVKHIFVAKWKKYYVVYSNLTSSVFAEDFQHHVWFLEKNSPSTYLVQLIGYCKNAIITEFYKFGSALNVQEWLKHELKPYNSISLRLNLCLNYAEILHFLHSNPFGTFVMCDSSSLDKTLSQFLLTEDFKLVLNDCDALPQVAQNGIICGHKQLYGEFVAPEQLWNSPEEFSEEQMIPYDEKSDIWKVPDVCEWFLGDFKDSISVKLHLFSLHKRCKDRLSQKRPTAEMLIGAYRNVLKLLDDNADFAIQHVSK